MKKMDYLYNTDIKRYQDEEMFKMNSDTRNLGNFLEFKKNDYTILDVGTNNGALLLYASVKNKAKYYYGVDINEKALELAKENMNMNGLDNSTFYHSEFQNLKMEQVDYIVSNPPYFDGDHVSENIDKRKARFAVYLPIEDLIKHSKRLLKDRGSLFLVYPSFKLPQVISLLDKYKFGVIRLQFVYDENKDDSLVFLIEARKGMKHYSKVLAPIYNKR
jgi:tRNA1(Val) A37 N6-methylase TrmN6